MIKVEQTPFYDEDTSDLLGFVAKDSVGWRALTVFGYQIARTNSQQEAEALLQNTARQYSKGVWQYFDQDDRDWYPCVIREAYENKVVIDRTNELGIQVPEDRKYVIIENPTEETFVKSA